MILWEPASLSLLAFILIGAVSGLVQGFTGFGFGIVAMALAPMLGDVRFATIWVLILSFLVCAAGVRLCWKDFQWQKARGLIAGSVIGAPIGILLLNHADPLLFKRLLGLMLVAFPISQSLKGKAKVEIPSGAALPVGIFGGMLGGAFNMSGPPIVLFTYSQPWSRKETVAVLQATFVSSMVVRLACSAASGMFTAPLLKTALFSLPLSFLGFFAGQWFGARWDSHQTRRVINALILVMGVKYLCFS